MKLKSNRLNMLW